MELLQAAPQSLIPPVLSPAPTARGSRLLTALRAARGPVLVAAVLAVGAAAAWLGHSFAHSAAQAASREPAPASPPAPGRVTRDGPFGLVVPDDMARRMGLATDLVRLPTGPRPLPPFQGCLALDANRLTRVHARFPGEIVAVGQTSDPADPAIPASASTAAAARPLRFGDPVKRSQLLAVLWSKDLGEKKSELVDALARYRADDVLLRRLEDALKNGSVPERSWRDAERNVQADRIALDRAERTLRSWRLTDDEIAAVKAEADALRQTGSRSARTDPGAWARVEVRAPQDGVILEKNVSPGDIVDTSLDLFKIGDLSSLNFWAHLYEEDLPLIQALPRPAACAVTLPSRPGDVFPATLETVGAVIDPNQHTALVTGHVDNPLGDLKVGQFVTVAVQLPAPRGELELPAEAVAEDGRESLVFVQPKEGDNRFERRTVFVTRRLRDAVFVRADTGGLAPGARVVTRGALLLRDAMDALPTPK